MESKNEDSIQVNNMNSLGNNYIRRNRKNNTLGNSSQINLLKISAEAYNFLTKGELVFDLKKEELTWTVKGEKAPLFKKNYETKKEIEKFNILKNTIKDLRKIDDSNRHLLKVKLIQSEYSFFNFSFQDKNSKYNRDRFYNLLKYDTYSYYKNEFQNLSIKQQKQICLLLNNKYLFSLYRKLIKCNNNIEKNWEWIKHRYPEAININLGKNLIQLSRDEELIMLSQKKYNTTKLINSDISI